MKKYNREDVQVDDRRVLVREKPGQHFSNWKTIAEFHFQKDQINPREAAIAFAELITA